LEPQNLRFGGGVTQSFLSPIVLLAIILAGVLICTSGRRKALAAFLSAAILIPPDQVLLLGGVHFPMLRILALCGVVRFMRDKLSKNEPIFSGGINAIDKAMIALSLLSLISGMLLWQVWAQLVFQLGNILSALGAYFLLRFLIRDSEDVGLAIRVLAVISMLVTPIVLYERFTGVNFFYSTLGGSRADLLGSAAVRDSAFRAAGPFAISILAGTFGGVLLPLFLGMWWRERTDRKYVVLGIAASVLICFSTSSSTALLGLLGGIVGLCFWPLRRRMQIIRWGIVGSLVMLHLYMKSPVWHLVSDIDLTGSSSSYHRYQLINQCIIHFWDWVLVGTKSYADWGWDMYDLCNQYVAIADQSGLIPLLSFITTIVLGFRYLGRARRSTTDRRQQLFLWALNASLFANVVAFFGVSYYDQTIVVWYALLAMICAMATSVRRERSDSALLRSQDNLLGDAQANQPQDIEIPFVSVRP
jgi:hypothetical protein